MTKQVEEKKPLMFRSIRVIKRSKRQLTRILSIETKVAQVLFRFCDVRCLVNSTYRLNMLRESVSSEYFGQSSTNRQARQVHPSLVSQNDLTTQFRNIKVSLPSGNDIDYP